MVGISKLSPRLCHTNMYIIFGYNLIGNGCILIEKILLLPYLIFMFRIFNCNETLTNIGGENVTSGFETCWTASHFVLVIFAIISILFYAILILLSLWIFSASYSGSPFPCEQKYWNT